MRQILAGVLAVVGAVLAPGCTTENPYTGEPFTRTRKIYVRRIPPIEEEEAAKPPKPYEQLLREEEARREALAVPTAIEERSAYHALGVKETRRMLGKSPRPDPFDSYEADRKAVLYRAWADTGKPDPIEPVVKPERPIEDDPFAPIQPSKKKPIEGEEKPAEAPAEEKKE